ncbi:MAG: lytic murein transglycosylase [Desulfobacterales bacterium]|nr:lytic murein transglycosylase [Desulfobacterales bacterium]
MIPIRIKFSTIIVLLTGLLILIAVPSFQNPAIADSSRVYFEFLQEKLIKEGFDKSMIKDFYSRPEVYFDFKGVSQYFVYREAKLNYDQFTSKSSIKKAKSYMKKYNMELLRAERIYGVDKKIITAIILVETRLGKVIGNRSILNTLSTLASLSDLNIREIVWDKNSSSCNLTREEFNKWSDRKSKWAYSELKAFLVYVNREGIDPAGINGSFAGALGIAQFMPSSILAFAKDGDGDGSVDLFNHADAISSIATYLSHYGWHPEIDRKGAYKVVYHYNHSEYYVNTILKISELLTAS